MTKDIGSGTLQEQAERWFAQHDDAGMPDGFEQWLRGLGVQPDILARPTCNAPSCTYNPITSLDEREQA